MADLTYTEAQVGLIDPGQAETYDFEKAETLLNGQPVFVDSNGKLQLADANASGEDELAGLVIAKQGRGVTVIKRGRVAGFDLSGSSYWDPIFLSDTVGTLSDTAGTNRVMIGRVVPMSDSDKTKVLYVDAAWGGKPAATGIIPLDITALREIATNDTQALAAHGGLLASDSDPSLARVNGATDKALRVIWDTSNDTDEVQFPPVIMPADLDAGQDVTIHLLMAMGGATDTPTVDVQVFDGVGDTEMGSATAAVTGTSVAEYTATVAAANVSGHPLGFLNIALAPGEHTTDALYLYGAWVEYVRA